MRFLGFASILLFAASVAAVYVVAGAMTVRYVVRRFVHKTPIRSRAWLWSYRAVLAVAVFGLGCMAYGRFVEPTWLEVTHVRLETPKLPAGSRPIRIVQVSDLHCDPAPRLEGRLPDVIAAERPDIIVFTGDAVNVAAGLPHFRTCMARLAAIAPTFAGRGNWDYGIREHLNFYGDTGVQELKGEAVRVDVRGRDVYVAGIPCIVGQMADQAMAAVPEGALTVFLFHSPARVLDVPPDRVDLYCCGHTHGGQVALPLYGALITLSKHGKRFESGLYDVDGMPAYVNRGIGMEGGRVPRVRFWARPEITVFDFVPKKN